MNIIPSKASHRNDIDKYGSNSSVKDDSALKFFEYDWETLDDPLTRTKCRAWETLANALNDRETSDSTVIVTIAKEFSPRCILHEAISLGVPDHVLMQLADRFPISLTQLDGNGRYPVHVACAFGASSEFVSYCIDMNPSSAAAKDIEGRTPTHLLCQGTCRDFWDVKSNPAAEKNMTAILWMLYLQAPLSVISEDNHGVGSIEYALESNIGIVIIQNLQEMIRHFNKNEAHTMDHRKSIAARRQFCRENIPHMLTTII